MRKFVLMMALFMSVMMYGQIVFEQPKLSDNVYVGIEGGVSTPLNFNSVFPINSIAGLKVGKDITPIIGLEAEGQVFFNDNNVGRWTNTFVKGTNVGLNGTINLTNLFFGYKERTFNIKTNTGLGWLHQWNSSNDLSAKTAVDLNINIKKHSFTVSPGVYWNLSGNNKVQFNKNFAQLAVIAGYSYHFGNFKTHDLGVLNSEIERLNSEINELRNKQPIVKTIIKKIEVTPKQVVFFAKGSSELTPEAKEELNLIKRNEKVNVIGYASPEGSADFNNKLSQERAEAVANYLLNRGVAVNNVVGLGVQGEASNRVVIIRKQ